jgi:polar amino acid transport system substrate-binding protein
MLAMIGCGEKKVEGPSAAESMRKNKTVRIVTDAVTAPFVFGKDTGVQGLDVDIGTEIGKVLGIEVKWIKVSGYGRLFELLKNGDAEILISAVAVDPKKETDFSFSHPYYESGDIIAIQKGKLDIKDLASLSGKKVGVATGRPGDAFMTAKKDISVKGYATLDDALGALNRAEVDAIVGDEPFLTYSSVNSYKNTMLLPTLVNTYQYAVAVRKTEPELLAKVNEAIDRLKASGELKKLDETWMGNVRKEAKDLLKGEVQRSELEKSPKVINVNITKLSGAWNMDRLDGFVLVLEGASGRYESTPILTEGNKGNCKFARPVPPGDYRLNLRILQMATDVPVPPLPKTALTMDLSIGRGITIAFR